MEHPQNKLWFRAKRYGWGWTPVTWQGWASLGIYLFLIIHQYSIFLTADESSYTFMSVLNGFILPVGLTTALLIMLCYGTGEKPRWRWGEDEKDGTPAA